MKFYKMKNSFGIYASGLNIAGSKSNYCRNIKSAVLAMANFYFKPVKNHEIKLWDAYFVNLFTTFILEVKNNISLTNLQFYQSGMYVRQDAVSNGENSNHSKTYIKKVVHPNRLNLQSDIKTKKIDWNINYTHVSGDGYFLNPREWGRDLFYNFLPRKYNKDAGNVNAFSTYFTYQTLSQKPKLSLSYGYFKLPEISNIRLNK